MQIAIDTNIFIYHLESHPTFGPPAKRLLQAVESGRYKAVVSMVTYAELLTLPNRAQNESLAKKYQELLCHFPNLTLVPVDLAVGHEAARLRGKHPKLKLMDAFILATALCRQAETLVTEDGRLMIPELPLKIQSLEKFKDPGLFS